VNREEGFIGTSLRKDEYVTDCSDIDDIIVFTKSGHMMITKVDSKTFIGKNIIHVAVFKKKDKRTTYNMIYKDGRGGSSYVKRYFVTGVTRDKLYDLTAGKSNSDVIYFSANPNGEAEVVTINLRQVGSIKKLKWDLDFADVTIKGRASKGNIVTKYAIKRIELKEKGLSTLKPRKLWFDDTVQRLNVDSRGTLLGEFTSEDRLLIINQKGLLKTAIPELTLRFDDDIIVLEKWVPNKPLSIIYWEGDKELFYIKRFLVENPDKEEKLITDHPKSYLEKVFVDYRPMAEIVFAKKRGEDRKDNLSVNIEEFISVKGITAMGNQLSKEKILEINSIEPLPYEPPVIHDAKDIEVVDEENIQPEAKAADVKPIKDDKDGSDTKTTDKEDDGGQTKLF
jgi:topoisomerase-4 subunit A